MVAMVVMVTAVQVAIWSAVQLRGEAASQLAQVAQKGEAEVLSAEGKVLEGKSRYVVRYRFDSGGKAVEGEEHFSMRQPKLPQQGQKITVFFDPKQPDWNTLTDPRLAASRMATAKLWTLGFSAFTYAFLYVIWKGRPKDDKPET
jgi:hypothetical protein